MHQISALILPGWLLLAKGDFGQELLEQFRSTLLYKIYFALTKAREKWLVVICDVGRGASRAFCLQENRLSY